MLSFNSYGEWFKVGESNGNIEAMLHSVMFKTKEAENWTEWKNSMERFTKEIAKK
jgi:hypothetical protein